MDFWEKMGKCISCYWLKVKFNSLEERPELYKCDCYPRMPLEWFRRQRKCCNYTGDSFK